MPAHDDDRFRLRPRAPKSRGPRSSHFVSQVLRQVSQASPGKFGAGGMRPTSTFGRGPVAASLAGPVVDPRARRVVIKSRFVVVTGERDGPASIRK